SPTAGQSDAGLGSALATILGATLTVSSWAPSGNSVPGGLYNDGTSSLTVTGSTVADNRATGGAASSGGSAGQGIGGGAFFTPGGKVGLDAFTLAHVTGNHASTSDDDLFGVFTTCP